MVLYIRQKVFSIGDKYNIYNEAEQPVYTVEGQVFALGAKLRLYDMAGRELFYIERQLFRFMPEYHIYGGGVLRAVVKKRFTFFGHELDIDSDYGTLAMDGEVFGMDFTITQDGRLLGSLSKKWFSFGDSYELAVADDADPAFFCALSIAIDNCVHNENK